MLRKQLNKIYFYRFLWIIREGRKQTSEYIGSQRQFVKRNINYKKEFILDYSIVSKFGKGLYYRSHGRNDKQHSQYCT